MKKEETIILTVVILFLMVDALTALTVSKVHTFERSACLRRRIFD